MKQKRFIGVSGEVVNNKLIYLCSGLGDELTDLNGISTPDAIEFLHNLAVKHKKTNTVFICYAFKVENENIFRDLPRRLKDELLQSHTVKKEIDELILIKEDLENVFCDLSKDLSEQESIQHYNKIREIDLALNDTGKITYNNYRITLANGKQLTISRKGVTITIYDVFTYFKKSLPETVERFLNIVNDALVEDKSADLHQRQLESQVDCFFMAELMKKVFNDLDKNGITLNRFHGASSITGAVLNKAKARTEFKNFKRSKDLSENARKAVTSAFYGARTEQLKLGRFENINVYDLNSAYAKACCYLPPMLRHPSFANTWNNQPFSYWFIEYDLPKNIHYGLLPNRDTSQLIRYKRRGKGYYYQPEIYFLKLHYPDCFKIKHGFYVPYKQSNFSLAIQELYNLRLQLKAQNNPLEKVIKLALATIYGKFCQRVGYAYYYNLHYAGFITSYVRAQLMNATHGKESKTICFLTDAIHTTADLSRQINISDKLGDFRHNFYNKGVYLGAGIYELENEKTGKKKATQGYTELDFTRAFETLKENGTYEAFQDYFIGHNLHSLMPVEFGKYLTMQRKTIKISPLESKVRLFDKIGADLEKYNYNSELIDSYTGRESLEYRPNNNDNKDVIFDRVEAKKNGK